MGSASASSFVDDLFGFALPSSNLSTQQPLSGGGGGGLQDLFSDLSMIDSSQGSGIGTGRGAKGKAISFEAYNKDGIVVTFNFETSPKPGVCRVMAVFHNRNAFEVRDFCLMIAVPSYLKLQVKIASGTVLQAMSRNSITQKFQLTNTMHGKKQFTIRIKVVYAGNGKQREERVQVQFPDNCC